MEVRVADDFKRALEAAITRHVEAGILLSSPLVFGALQQIGELAIAKRLPLICLFVEFPKAAAHLLWSEPRPRSSEDAGIMLRRSCTVPSQVNCRYSGRRSSIW